MDTPVEVSPGGWRIAERPGRHLPRAPAARLQGPRGRQRPAGSLVAVGGREQRGAVTLEWAHEAGLLRVSGVAYQFRHRQLQEWLTLSVNGEKVGLAPAIADGAMVVASSIEEVPLAVWPRKRLLALGEASLGMWLPLRGLRHRTETSRVVTTTRVGACS